jgi:hypothetical protein
MRTLLIEAPLRKCLKCACSGRASGTHIRDTRTHHPPGTDSSFTFIVIFHSSCPLCTVDTPAWARCSNVLRMAGLVYGDPDEWWKFTRIELYSTQNCVNWLIQLSSSLHLDISFMNSQNDSKLSNQCQKLIRCPGTHFNTRNPVTRLIPMYPVSANTQNPWNACVLIQNYLILYADSKKRTRRTICPIPHLTYNRHYELVNLSQFVFLLWIIVLCCVIIDIWTEMSGEHRHTGIRFLDIALWISNLQVHTEVEGQKENQRISCWNIKWTKNRKFILKYIVNHP